MYFFEQIKDRFSKWFDFDIKLDEKYIRRISIAVFYIIIAIILTINFFPNRIDLEVGEVSKSDIVAPRTVTFIDQEKTEQLEDIAIESASKVYEEDKSLTRKKLSEIDNLFNTVLSEQISYKEQDIEQLSESILNSIKEENELKISTDDLKILLNTDLETI